MPKIMSAEEFANKISKRFYNGTINTTNLESFIQSRDSAMLEKYKEAMSKWLYNMMDGYPNTKFNKMEDADMRYALDSAFAEIDGGK